MLQENHVSASTVEKFIALIIDYIVIVIVGVMIFGTGLVLIIFLTPLLARVFSMLGINSIIVPMVCLSFLLLASFIVLYYSHAFKTAGQTFGEKIMKIKVVPAYGEKIHFTGGIFRLISLCPPLTFFIFLETKNSFSSESILEKLSGTCVIKNL